MRMYSDRNPSPPPTLIRRYSSNNDSHTSEFNETANLVAIDNARDRGDHRERLRSLKKMAGTQPSHFLEGVSYCQMVRDIHKKDTQSAFRCSKLYKLRKSPAYILWPRRPIAPEVDSTEDAASQASNDSDVEDDRDSKTPMREQWASAVDATKGNSDRKTTRRLSDDELTMESLKSHSNSSFWNNDVGSHLRVDSLFIGAPRRDPYNSTWTRDNRRCFFMAGTVPYHMRGNQPLPVMVEKKKDSVGLRWYDDDRRVDWMTRGAVSTTVTDTFRINNW